MIHCTKERAILSCTSINQSHSMSKIKVRRTAITKRDKQHATREDKELQICQENFKYTARRKLPSK